MTDAEIVELANMVRAMDQSPEGEALVQRFEDGFNDSSRQSSWMGNPAGFSDSPEIVGRCRSLAAHLGATVTTDETAVLVIRPAKTRETRQ